MDACATSSSTSSSDDSDCSRYESEDYSRSSAGGSGSGDDDGDSTGGNSSGDDGKKHRNGYECGDCGKKLRKPSLLKQHRLCHSNERNFCCPVDSCNAKYKRETHLKRHMTVKHDGDILSCTWPACLFSTRNSHDLKRHRQLHEKKGPLQRYRDKSLNEQRKHVCKEEKCGKAFRYPSQLRYHEETKHGEIYVDVICSEPGCNEHFDHPSDLAYHTRNAHKYVFCEVCGKQCMRQKIKRHYETHDKAGRNDRERIQCPYPDCSLSYLQENNLRKHIKVVHLKFRPYPCSHPDCEKSFAYRHVRDNHEKSVHIPGDFLAEDLKKTKKNYARKARTMERVEEVFLKAKQKKRPRTGTTASRPVQKN